MKGNNDYILLKWGTLKGCCFEDSPKSFEALKKYNEIGTSLGAMTQNDTPEQKQLICEMIENCTGSVVLAWDGEDCTNDKQKAKDYVLNYGK